MKDDGFTLTELAITLFIIGLILLLITPRLTVVLSADPEAVARRLAVTVRSCREHSIMTHQPYRIVFDFEKNLFFVETIVAEASEEMKFEFDTSVLHRPVKLPDDIRIVDVITPFSGKVKEGNAYLLLLRDGLFTGGIVHIMDEDKQIYSLKFLPLTGRLRYERGYLFEEVEEGAT